MNGSIKHKDIELVIFKKLLTKKSPGPGGFFGEFYQTFTELTSHKLQKIEGICPNLFYDAKTRQENSRSIIIYTHTKKIPKQNANKPNLAICKKDYMSWPSGIYEMQKCKVVI